MNLLRILSIQIVIQVFGAKLPGIRFDEIAVLDDTMVPCLPGTERNPNIQKKSEDGAYLIVNPGNNNIAQCTPCSPGTYSSGFGKSLCQPCVPGKFSPYFGSSKCIPCPLNTFTEEFSSITCKLCEPGLRTEYIGSSSCIPDLYIS